MRVATVVQSLRYNLAEATIRLQQKAGNMLRLNPDIYACH